MKDFQIPYTWVYGFLVLSDGNILVCGLDDSSGVSMRKYDGHGKELSSLPLELGGASFIGLAEIILNKRHCVAISNR